MGLDLYLSATIKGIVTTEDGRKVPINIGEGFEFSYNFSSNEAERIVNAKDPLKEYEAMLTAYAEHSLLDYPVDIYIQGVKDFLCEYEGWDIKWSTW